MAAPKTLYHKLVDRHLITEVNGLSLLYIDRHLVHEVTSPQAFSGLKAAQRQPWRRSSMVAMADHNVPTHNRAGGIADAVSRRQVEALRSNAEEFNVPLFDLDDARQGIVHVVGPEQGLTLPGMTVVCGDSHTSTHGALGALAFGIGTSEVEHVMATQSLWVKPAKTMRVSLLGRLPSGVYAKDLALYVIGQISASGGAGYALEFDGSVISELSMEARMSLCNMSIEAGARSGMVAVDDITLSYVHGRPFAPRGELWEQALAHWRTLHSDAGAGFDASHRFVVDQLEPQVSWGTSPDMVSGIHGATPNPKHLPEPVREATERALDYMGLAPDMAITDIRLDKIFIGSCTNARLEDLRIAAAVVRGKKVAPSIQQALVVPGSGLVKQAAEKEGLDVIFKQAGFSWREPGCSMCLGMNDDRLAPGERCASTSNRNFEGRQGPGGRTHLVSPAMAAAAAVAGRFVDVRAW